MSQAKKSYRFLFIGNSYTYYNELWDRVAEVAALCGIEATVDHVTKGGAKLSLMLDPESEYGQAVEQKLTTERYDTVILQDNSLRTIAEPEGFFADIPSLHAKIEANGAKTLLYQTWARRAGSSKFATYNLTVESMTQVIGAAYRKAAAEIGADVSPVGDAFYDIVCNHPEIDLYNADGTHPSPAGTALAALCMVGKIFNRSVADIVYPFGTENEEQAKLLALAANKAIGA